MLEIERKFLVKDKTYRASASSKSEMVQGFLNTDPDRTVRVRSMGAKAWLTVKGKSNTAGTTRMEWEYEIPLNEAVELLKICHSGVLRKIRYHVPVGCHIFEVDEFLDKNEGLILAEVELQDPDEAFVKPDWLGKEVTGNPAYYNSQLSLKPYSTWKE
ncbi:MAG: hypothetical protein RLZZ241_2379 [Bacteroidota bacterium]